MRILVVAATDMEIAPVVTRLRHTSDSGPRVKAYTFGDHDVDVLTTGVGMVATAAWCSHQLALTAYDLGLNFGVCGSFDRALAPGAVVQVVSDRIAELGAEDQDTFLTIQQLNLLGEDEFPLTGGRLVNRTPPSSSTLRGLPAVSGITVNTVHGRESSIADVVQRFKPQVESMEGAAFMYSCLILGVAFAQVRAVSNVVEPRNRDTWRINEAIGNLGRTALGILDDL
jgi:futalosine hydrolase